jgi:hypothetical protein
MIARYWRGWTEVQDADSYEKLLKEKVLPGLKTVEGYRGGYILRDNGPQEVESFQFHFSWVILISAISDSANGMYLYPRTRVM